MKNDRNSSYDFDAEKIMSMSRDEAISLLGEENAQRVREGLQNGTIDYSEFQRICESAFPYPQQAHLVRNVIFNQLSKSEGFNMFESNKEKQAEYSKISDWMEKASRGELTREDLKGLCDKVYGENSDLSMRIQKEFISQGKIREPEQTKKESRYSQNTIQEKKSWELNPEEKSRIQKQTEEVAKQHNENQTQQRSAQDNMQPQANSQMIQGSVPQQPTMDIGGMEI